MMTRKQKLRFTQISLLILGFLIIFFTYSDKNTSSQKIIPKETQEKIKKQIASQTNDGDVFYNIEYSGFDLSGNRYILKAKEAINISSEQAIVNMKYVEAAFYFKDDSILYVWSDSGKYNNITLDMIFNKNVRANYEQSKLFAEKAVYSNSESFLTITENVKVKDIRGTMEADKLFFDIKKQTLNIESFNDNKINANVNLK
tara:strand:- start:2654 stop:3256 length:603 start_codon:yes stop_codon:yes gene_type:complete